MWKNLTAPIIKVPFMMTLRHFAFQPVCFLRLNLNPSLALDPHSSSPSNFNLGNRYDAVVRCYEQFVRSLMHLFTVYLTHNLFNYPNTNCLHPPNLLGTSKDIVLALITVLLHFRSMVFDDSNFLNRALIITLFNLKFAKAMTELDYR